jgi:hypothetical protein
MNADQFRILAVSLSSRGFGYAVMEGNNRVVAYGNKVINKNKNARVLVHIEKVITRYRPNLLVLQDVNAKGTHRDPRIKELNRKIITLMKKRKLKTAKLSGTNLRITLLDNPKGTKHEMAESLAKRFPDELASRLPPKRNFYNSEDVRMDIFDAVALAVVFRQEKKSRGIKPNNSFRKLNAIGNVSLGKHKGFAGNSDDAFIGAATSCGRQLPGRICHVEANEGKITIGEFKNVGATTTADRFRSVFMRIGAKSAEKHGCCVHVAQKLPNQLKNAIMK